MNSSASPYGQPAQEPLSEGWYIFNVAEFRNGSKSNQLTVLNLFTLGFQIVTNLKEEFLKVSNSGSIHA